VPGLEDAPRMYRTLKRVLPPLTDRFFHTRVEGAENIPAVEPVILAMNHLSFIDSILVPVAVERPVYFLGKADYWDSWRTRWFFEGTGVVPVRRGGSGSGDAALATGVEILGRGDLLGIYPEGTRSPDGRLYRGKTGPVRMALEAGVRIVPVAVAGTDRAMPTGTYVPNRSPVTIRYGKPLDLSRFADRREDPFVLRSATDELMFEIMLLSGQEYVDEYAATVKSGKVRLGDDPQGGTTVEVDLTDEATQRRRAG
jgi:1-acyl-sn-glycerol-3-phosphate acyltransferase